MTAQAATRGGGRGATRLTRRDWLDAGQDILRERGFAAIKLRALLDRLGVTTGSFYHHFADIRQYLDALADDYAGANLERVHASPTGARGAERLAEMWGQAQTWRIPALDRAMRIWATSSPRAAAAVRAVDAYVLENVRTAFVEIGFDPEEARVRALLSFAAGAGLPLVFAPWATSPDDLERVMRIITAPAA